MTPRPGNPRFYFAPDIFRTGIGWDRNALNQKMALLISSDRNYN
jgi:hypothetical protein